MTEFPIPYGRQWIDEEDIQAVIGVLRAAWITQGPLIEQFEEALANYCGARYAVAVANGTAALHLACMAAGLSRGDVLFTAPNTFVASANCAFYCGAEPRLVDIDPRKYILAPGKLELCLRDWDGPGKPTVVVPVHFSGRPCDPGRLTAVARAHGLTIIEDACHALGAEWRDEQGNWQRIGNCSHADMAVLSFHPVKHITTGEGGAILTNDGELYRKLTELRNHGITKDPDLLEQSDGPWYYEMQRLGFNYRITDFQCALGLSQLRKIDGWVARRREIAASYDRAFADVEDLILPDMEPDVKSSYHLYVVQVRDGDVADRRRVVFEKLRDRGIGVQVHYIPVHYHPYYRERLGCKRGDFPEAEKVYARCFSLPIFPALTDREVSRVADELKDALVKSR